MGACSVMVIIDASQALDPGSIPGRRTQGTFWFGNFFFASIDRILRSISPCRAESVVTCTMYAHVAQLGERQTEDLKVLGSIPSVGTHLLW